MTNGATPLANGPTEIVQTGEETSISLHHPTDAFEKNLRAYFSSIPPALKCHMDVQYCNGYVQVLRYVTDYITKATDALTSDMLYSNYVDPHMASYRFLRQMNPAEPEMWFSLSNTRRSSCSNVTKKFVPPNEAEESSSLPVMKYRDRSAEDDNLSLLQWLRLYNEAKTGWC